MSQPIVALSDNLSEARRQLKDIMPFKGDPETLHTFVSRVDYVISLYQTNDVRQTRILLGAIKRNLDGQVTRSLGLPNIEDWPTLEARLIEDLKHQTTNFWRTSGDTIQRKPKSILRRIGKTTSNIIFKTTPGR